MSETPRPVRGWAQFDGWSVLLIEAIRFAGECQTWDISTVPLTGDGYPRAYSETCSLAEAIPAYLGPLRSIRILLSTGHTIELVRKADSVTIAQGQRAVMLEPGCMKFSLFASEGAWLHGGWYMPEVTDTDAVTRALSEATNWLNEAAKAAE